MSEGVLGWGWRKEGLKTGGRDRFGSVGEYISRVGTVDKMGCAKEELGGQLLICGYDVMTCF
jgi:hypothetical protein